MSENELIAKDVSDFLAEEAPGGGDESDEIITEGEQEVKEGEEEAIEEVNTNEEEVEEEQEESEEVEEVDELEESVEEEEVVEEEDEDEEISEEASLRDQNAALLARIESLTAGKPVSEVDPVEKPEEKKSEIPLVPVNATAKDIMGDLDIDEVVSDPELFTGVIGKAMAVARQETMTEVLKAIPQIVQTQLEQQTTIKAAVDDFYSENADLKVAKNTVGAIVNELAASDPSMKMEDLFAKAAVQTREVLGLTKKAIRSKTKKSPAFVKKPKAKVGNLKQNVTKLQKEIDDIL